MRFFLSIALTTFFAMELFAQSGTSRLLPANTHLSPARDQKSAGATARGTATSKQSVAPLKMAQAVKWMSLDEALEKSKTEPRKILIDVYTEWCGWCKHMDKNTFSNATVAKYINDTYYAVKFDAEDRRDITYKDKVYRFKREGSNGYHELAAHLLNNRLEYPHTVFLDESNNLIQAISGYLEANKMLTILNYFGTDSHRKTPWETYERNFTAQQ